MGAKPTSSRSPADFRSWHKADIERSAPGKVTHTAELLQGSGLFVRWPSIWSRPSARPKLDGEWTGSRLSSVYPKRSDVRPDHQRRVPPKHGAELTGGGGPPQRRRRAPQRSAGRRPPRLAKRALPRPVHLNRRAEVKARGEPQRRRTFVQRRARQRAPPHPAKPARRRAPRNAVVHRGPGGQGTKTSLPRSLIR